MTVYCDGNVLQEKLCQTDWVVSEDATVISLAIQSGCNTIFLGEKTMSIHPTLFAPSKEEALRFIKAHNQVR